MTTCMVTGAAGFIGSHLCELLLQRGHTVVGVDSFVPYYPREIKERNLAGLRNMPGFTFHAIDLRDGNLMPALEQVERVIHLAAVPGLPRSWSDFDLYMTCNMQATQRLLEAIRTHGGVKHFIYGSTSSVYGRIATGTEEAPLAPFSPYGITKLAAEHLAQAYAANYAIPLTILRFFSVYGPRQRPDMAYHIFIRALLTGEEITVYGDGEQSRSNTYVADCVEGVALALEQHEASVGQIFNIGGGQVVTVNQVIEMLQELTERQARVRYAEARVGDQRHTAADVNKARRLLGYNPQTPVIDGLRAQLDWQRELLDQQR